MTLDEQKRVMLNILVEFAKFCDEHDLMYYLDAGTLIGAVRHKGFIPWDDDIDVNMPQKDYDKFIELTRNSKGYLSEHIQVEYPENTIYSFLKISDDRTILVEFPAQNPMEVGVYIDVFQLFKNIYALKKHQKVNYQSINSYLSFRKSGDFFNFLNTFF